MGHLCSRKNHTRTKSLCFLTADLPHCHSPDYQQEEAWITPSGWGGGLSTTLDPNMAVVNSSCEKLISGPRSSFCMILAGSSLPGLMHNAVLRQQMENYFKNSYVCLVTYQYQASLANHVIIGFQNNWKVSNWSQSFYPSSYPISTCASASLNALHC